MIISASRRTDIPAYYSEWFLNRISEKYLYVRNPMNVHQISKVNLDSSVIDGIVFWTKNPIPMMDKILRLSDYNYYFQYTITPYGPEVEKKLPSKTLELIPAFVRLSSKIGKERVIWRYDPVFLNDIYTIAFHKKQFREMASKLGCYTEKCTVSFLDLYKTTARNVQHLAIRVPERDEQYELLSEFSKIAAEYGFQIDTCAEDQDFSRIGIHHASCIDKERFERLSGKKLIVKKDNNQREACGCVDSIDIGAYNTCPNGCVYCYANYSKTIVDDHIGCHDPRSPLLYGKVTEEDSIKERTMKSLIQRQISLFDM